MSNFDDLMSQMGVRRLDDKKGGKRKKKTQGRGPAPAAPQARRARTAPAPAPAPAAAPAVAPAVAPTPPAAPAREVAGLRDEVSRLRAELQAARDRATGLSAEVEHLRERSREQLDALQHERDTLDAERRGLQRRLEQAKGAVPEPVPDLPTLLSQRGLKGELEAARLFAAVGEARRTGELVRLLEPVDADRMAGFLEERVVLLGGCDACPSAGGRAVVSVPKERCEVCAGSDVQRAVRTFLDVCLVNGATRVVIVGGSPKYHRQLRELVQHHRVKLTLVSGVARRTTKQAKADQEHNDLVILWGGTLLDHSVSELYGDGPARVVTVPHRGISLMLQRAAEIIAGGS